MIRLHTIKCRRRGGDHFKPNIMSNFGGWGSVIIIITFLFIPNSLLKIVFSNELKWSFTNPTLIFPLSQGFRLPRRIPPSIVPCVGSTGHPMEARPTPRKGSWWRRKRREAFDADAHRRRLFDRRFRFANDAYPPPYLPPLPPRGIPDEGAGEGP